MRFLIYLAFMFSIGSNNFGVESTPTHDDCVDPLPFPDPTDCTSFYQCFDIGDGQWYLVHLQCSPGGYYDTKYMACVLGICENPPTTLRPPTTSPPGSHPCDIVCPQMPGDYYIPNPSNCGSFYRCNFGTPILQVCPPNLVFNPLLDVCDYPYRTPPCNPIMCP